MLGILVALVIYLYQTTVPALQAGAPVGQGIFRYSRLFGLLAFCLVVVQLLFTLIASVGLFPKRSNRLTQLHVIFGGALLAVVFLHVVLFITGSTLRTGSWSWHSLSIDFNSGYYRSAVSIGLLALCGLVFLMASGWIRLRPTQKVAKGQAQLWPVVIHRVVSLLVTVAIVYHSFSIGSETRNGMVLVVLTGTLLLLALLFVIYRSGESSKQTL